MVAYSRKNVDKAVAVRYPAEDVSAADMETGYLLMSVDERAGKVDGIHKSWNEKSGIWETGDTFTLR